MLSGCGAGSADRKLIVGIIGNSKACGYYQTGWESLVPGNANIDAAGLLTQTGEDNPNILGWGQELQRWLKQKDPRSIVYNMAGSGWTTKNHIELGTVQILANKSPKPTIVFVALNVNDRLKDTVTISPANGGISWANYLANTTTIVNQLKAAGIRPILVKEDNQAFAAGAGTSWAEYDTGMGVTNTGTNDATHRAYSDYVDAYDTIGASLGVTVLDAYTPSLNTGQEAQYSYLGVQAPANFRYSLMYGTYTDIGVNDVWHQNDAGGEIILNVYKNFFNSVL
jgi:lysophospholipase L1-like esterase